MEQKQLLAQAEAEQYNAALALQRAEQTGKAYGQREDQVRREARSAAGARRAAAAQSGLGTTGSMADVERQSQVAAELDALNVRYQGQLESRALTEEAKQAQYRAEMNRFGANAARRSTNLNTLGKVLSGVANTYSSGKTSVPAGTRG
jgi:hypothetical protein